MGVINSVSVYWFLWLDKSFLSWCIVWSGLNNWWWWELQSKLEKNRGGCGPEGRPPSLRYKCRWGKRLWSDVDMTWWITVLLLGRGKRKGAHMVEKEEWERADLNNSDKDSDTATCRQNGWKFKKKLKSALNLQTPLFIENQQGTSCSSDNFALFFSFHWQAVFM